MKAIMDFIFTIAIIIGVNAYFDDFLNLKGLLSFITQDISCDDKQVQDLIYNIYHDNIKNTDNPLLAMYAKSLPNIQKIEDIRTYANNKPIKICKAVAYFDNETKSDLTYSVQVENQKIYVEIDEKTIQSILMTNMMKILNN